MLRLHGLHGITHPDGAAGWALRPGTRPGPSTHSQGYGVSVHQHRPRGWWRVLTPHTTVGIRGTVTSTTDGGSHC